jgi:hypothetical protein
MTDISPNQWKDALLNGASELDRLLKQLSNNDIPDLPNIGPTFEEIGALKSLEFKNSARLNECAKSNNRNIKTGDSGEHVKLIHDALIKIPPFTFPTSAVLVFDGLIGTRKLNGFAKEYAMSSYGPYTARAVLKYKTHYKIINRTYQSAPDDIVGIMTIKHMDMALLALPRPTPGRIGPFSAPPSIEQLAKQILKQT